MIASRIRQLSIVLPAFNEEGNLHASVCGLLGALDAAGVPGEVVVVDDGSTDATAEVLAGIGDARLRVVRHARNQGYGAALTTGFRAATGDHVFFTDADLQFDPTELARLLGALGAHDMVVGYRAPRRDPLARRVYGRLWTALVNRLLDVGVRDVNCAFKLFPASLVRIPLRSAGAGINGELLARARGMCLRIGEVAVTHRPRRTGSASGAQPRVVVRAVRELLALRAAEAV